MNIANLLLRAAQDHPDRVALRRDDVEITYARLAEMGARFAGHLRAGGLVASDRVGVFLPNCVEYVPALLGVWQAGGIGVPLNYLFPEAALRHAVSDSGAQVLLALPGDAERLRATLDGLPVAANILTVGDTFEEALANATPATGIVPRLDGDEALLMYTSGSTGVPKGVRQTHRNIGAEVDAVIDLYALTGADHLLNPIPMFHVGGLQCSTMPVLLRGGQVTLMAKWDALTWLDLAQRHRPTFGGLISTMLIDVGNRVADAPLQLDSFRHFMFGGSRTPSAAIERLERGIGVTVIEIYGQTEQSGIVVTYAAGEPRRPGSMGRPMEQVVATQVVPPGGTDLEPGSAEVGELWVRGDAVTPGYWNKPELFEERLTDGWFRTGDLVRRDAEGFLFYVDRIDDMIVSGGENIFPQMVEEHLANCPDIAEVAVIGTPHERWVEQVTAIVVPKGPEVTAEAIAAYCATDKNLQGMHRPRRIEFVSALPRTGSGKLDRPQLKKTYR